MAKPPKVGVTATRLQIPDFGGGSAYSIYPADLWIRERILGLPEGGSPLLAMALLGRADALVRAEERRVREALRRSGGEAA